MIKFSTVVLAIAALVFYFYPEPQLPVNKEIDKIVVLKNKRIMEVYSNDTLIKTYKIALGQNSGDKEFEGDKRTPEGSYTINDKNPNSAFHKNLGISYPNANDMADAKNRNVSPGGDIKIHGLKNGLGFIGKFHRLTNWTAGCIAVTDAEMDELYAQVKTGTPILIKP